MELFQDLAIEEKRELDEKIVKLDYFVNAGEVFTTLDTEEKRRLLEQLKIMRRYSEILEIRISHFK